MDSPWPADLPDYDELRELLAMWHDNPVQPFVEVLGEDEYLAGLYSEFDYLHDKLRRAVLFDELRSHRQNRIDRAINTLESILRTDPQDEEAWALRIRAVASKRFSEARLLAVIDEARRSFSQGLPAALRRTIDLVGQKDTRMLFKIEAGTPRPQDRAELEALNTALGISSASALELHESKLEPLECIRQTQHRLWFSGILATKWVDHAVVREEFKKLLTTFDRIGGDVRFLVIDPESDGYRRFGSERWGDSDKRSVAILQQLQSAHPCLQVRLYDALPTFRIILIDDTLASFSPYLVGGHTQNDKSGWDAPHIVLDRNAPWPLAQTFETLFSESWRVARELSPHASEAGNHEQS